MKAVVVSDQELVALRLPQSSQITLEPGWEELKEMVSLVFWKLSGVAVQPGVFGLLVAHDANYGLQWAGCKGARCWDAVIIEEKEFGRTLANDPYNAFAGPDWNRDAVRAYFAARSESDEQYLKELKRRLVIRPAYQGIYDQTLASYYVHNHFRGRSWLSTREDFLQALSNLETSIIPADNFFDRERFATSRLNLIRALFQAASPGN
jgi:hypothetical protein